MQNARHLAALMPPSIMPMEIIGVPILSSRLSVIWILYFSTGDFEVMWASPGGPLPKWSNHATGAQIICPRENVKSGWMQKGSSWTKIVPRLSSKCGRRCCMRCGKWCSTEVCMLYWRCNSHAYGQVRVRGEEWMEDERNHGKYFGAKVFAVARRAQQLLDLWVNTNDSDFGIPFPRHVFTWWE